MRNLNALASKLISLADEPRLADDEFAKASVSIETFVVNGDAIAAVLACSLSDTFRVLIVHDEAEPCVLCDDAFDDRLEAYERLHQFLKDEYEL